MGERIIKVDAYDKARGKHLYPSDYYEEGMLYLGLKRSEHPHAVIRNLHLKEALKVPGVVRIFTHKDVNGTNRYGVVRKDQEVLVERKARYVGDPICLVAAESKEALSRALSLIKVDYEVLPAVFDPLEALKDDAPLVHEGGNLLKKLSVSVGDVEKGFEEADVVVEGEYVYPIIDHAPLETEAGFAKWEDGKIVIWAGTQTPFRDRREISEALGIPEDMVRVIAPFFGGGFGRKDGITVQIHLALAVLYLKRPVKLVYSREESIQSSYHRHPAIMRYRTGAKRDGTLTAVKAELYFDTGAYASFGAEVMSLAVEHFGGPYKIPNAHVDGYAVYTNNVVCGAMRGFGVPQVNFAFESQMDELALVLKMDPWEIRYKNAIRRGDKSPIGHTLIYSVGLREALKKLKKSDLWKKKDGLLKTNSPFKKRGWGIACSYQGGGLGVGIPDYAEAKIELLPDGKYRVYAGISDMGQGNASSYVHIASMVLNAPMELFELVLPDTDRTLDSGPSSASRTTYIYGKALVQACEQLKNDMFYAVSERYGVPVEELQLKEDSVAWNEGSVSLSEVYELLPPEKRVSTSYVEMPLAKDRREIGSGLPHIIYAFAAHLALVEVDTLTGEVRVLGYATSTDVGKILNLSLFEGQVQGGVTQGIGAALMEEMKLSNGKVLNPDFTTYMIPTASDIPDIEVLTVDGYEPTGPFGLKGAGEISVDGPPPAIGNAIRMAIGRRMRKIPFTPEKVLMEILKGDSGS